MKIQIGWLVFSSLGSKLIQLSTSALLMLYLSPDQFGLVALPLSIYYILLGSLNFGFESALIQGNYKDDKSLVSTAFFLEVLKGIILAIMVFSLKGLIIQFTGINELSEFLNIVALIFLVDSFKNVRLFELKKNLNFRLLSLVEITSVFVGNFCSLFFVIYLKLDSFYLLIGHLISRCIYVLISHIIAKPVFKFHFDSKSFTELFSFGGWLMLSSIFSIFRSQILNLLIPRFSNTMNLGFYNRSYVYSEELFGQANNLLWKFGFPFLSKLKNGSQEVASGLDMLRIFISLIITPVIVAYFLFADFFIETLFGGEWLDMIPFIRPMLLISYFVIIQAPFGMLYQSLGMPKVNTFINISGGILFFILLYPLYLMFGLVGLVYASLVSVICTYIFSEYYVASRLKIKNLKITLLNIVSIITLLTFTLLSIDFLKVVLILIIFFTSFRYVRIIWQDINS